MNINDFSVIVEDVFSQTEGECDVIVDGCKDFELFLKTDEDGVNTLEIISKPKF